MRVSLLIIPLLCPSLVYAGNRDKPEGFIKTSDGVIIFTNHLAYGGVVSSFDKLGKKILNEKPINGRSLIPALSDDQRSCQVTESFETSPDDSYMAGGVISLHPKTLY